MTVTSLRTEERKNKGKPQLARYTVTIDMPAPVTRSDIGTIAGNRVTLTAGQCDITNPTYGDQDGVQMLNIPYVAVPTTAGNDEVSLAFT
jgi:hypothetical protein